MEKAELIITALQQRIGEIVSNYETQIALVRAELTSLSELNKEQQEIIQEYSKVLEEKGIVEQTLTKENESLNNIVAELRRENEITKKVSTKATKKPQ